MKSSLHVFIVLLVITFSSHSQGADPNSTVINTLTINSGQTRTPNFLNAKINKLMMENNSILRLPSSNHKFKIEIINATFNGTCTITASGIQGGTGNAAYNGNTGGRYGRGGTGGSGQLGGNGADVNIHIKEIIQYETLIILSRGGTGGKGRNGGRVG